MAEIGGPSDFGSVPNPAPEPRPLPGVSRPQASPISQSTGAPARDSSTVPAAPTDAVDINPPDQVSVAYKIDQKVQQIYVQFVDSKTGAVINQLPPPQVLAFEEQIAQYLESRQQAGRAPVAARTEAGAKDAKEG